MTDRRFNEAEVAAIFERATDTRRLERGRPAASTDGMTLAELQEIGREAGIAPAQIAEAARVVAQGAPPAPRTFLGLPIGVGRTVDLQRPMTEHEWERLVGELRETFDAKGKLRHEGSLWSWTNSRLQVMLEPTEHGQRLRLKTLKSGARERMLGGAIMVIAAVIGVGAAAVLGTSNTRLLPMLGVVGVLGAIASVGTAVRLPGWARRRERQFEAIAERVASRMSETTVENPPSR